MGTWGTKSFDNDDALDWMADFCDDPTVSRFENTFKIVLDNPLPSYSESACAVAAAEIVAVLRGQKPEDQEAFTEEEIRTIGAFKQELPDNILNLSLSAVEKIASDSELKSAYTESGSAADFSKAMAGLITRLKKAKK